MQNAKIVSEILMTLIFFIICLSSGDFESEALLVPQHCIFDHEHDTSRCERPSSWSKTADKMCGGRDMKLESSGMLVVCGTDKFQGVEYVCCPKGEIAVVLVYY